MSAPATIQPHNFTNGGTEVLILRRCGHDRKSHGGFTYPSGVGSVVECDDWVNNSSCGNGLHGWPWSFGLGEGQDFSPNDLWIVLGALPEDVAGELDNGWKCKCRKATIRFEGDMKGAMDFLRAGFTACVKEMAKTSGDYAKNASSGDYAKNASSGDYAKNASSGDSAKNASSGRSATNASSGDSAKNASSGDSAKNEATGKDSTCASAGTNGRAKVGERGAFALAFWNEENGCDFLTGKVGVNGIKANTWYEIKAGKLVEVA